MKTLLLAFVACAASYAQSATPIDYPLGLYNQWKVQENQTVPSSPTVITTRNLILQGGWIECSTTRSITITDGNSNTVFPAIVVTAPAIVSLAPWVGAYFSGGFSISAGGTGCTYHMFWRQ